MTTPRAVREQVEIESRSGGPTVVLNPVVPAALRPVTTAPSQVIQGAQLAAFNAAVAKDAPKSQGMGFFDFLGDVVNTVSDVAGKIIPGGIAGALGGPIAGNLALAAPGIARGDLAAAAGAVLQGNVQAASLAQQVATGNYAGAIGNVLKTFAGTGFLSGPLKSPPPPSAIPSLPTLIPLRDPSVAQMQALSRPVQRAGTTISIGGPLGLNYSSGGGQTVATGYSSVRTGGGVTVAQARSALLANASENAGFRITWKKLLRMMLTCGLELVKARTGLDDSQLFFLYMNRPHRGRRGPFLRTIAKRARQVQGYRRQVARIASIIGATRRAPAHHHVASPRSRKRKSR